MKRLLVTGSSGLIGSEACLHFANLGWEIHGIGNNQRPRLLKCVFVRIVRNINYADTLQD